MAKSKLEKHLQELEDMTSGGAHDAVTFSGRGLGFLKDLFKSSKVKKKDDELEDDADELEKDDDEDCVECPECGCEVPCDDDECPECGHDMEKVEKGAHKHGVKKPASHMKKSHGDGEECIECPECGEECDDCNFCPNCGCDLSCADDDSNNAGFGGRRNGGYLEYGNESGFSDPGQRGVRQVITNHGRRLSGKGAVHKNAGHHDDLQKSFDRFEETYKEVLDASEALGDLTKHVRSLAKNNVDSMTQLQDSIRVLAKGLQQSLKAQASLAADLELIKKQPGTVPASGFVVMNNRKQGKSRQLSKSDIQDVLTDLMNEGNEDASHLLKKLGVLHTGVELKKFVDSLPAQMQEHL